MKKQKSQIYTSEKLDDTHYRLSFAVVHHYYRWAYALGYDPDCETIPFPELTESAVAFLMERESLDNSVFHPEDKNEVTAFEEGRYSPHPLEDGNISYLADISSRYSTYEFEDKDAWLFEHISLRTINQIGLNAAKQGAHDVRRDALKTCAEFERDAEWAVRLKQIPYCGETFALALAQFEYVIGTTCHEREVCEYLAADEWIRWKGVGVLTCKYNDAEGIRKVFDLKGANPNSVKSNFSDRSDFCIVRDIPHEANHGIPELEDKLRIRGRLVYPEENKMED